MRLVSVNLLYRGTFLCVFLIGIIPNVLGYQNNFLDSLKAYVDTATLNIPHVQNLLTIAHRYTYSIPDKAEPFLIKADSISQLLGENDRMDAVIQSHFGILYHQLSRYDEALEHTDRAIELFAKTGITQYQAITIQHKGKIYGSMNRDDLSHQAFTEAGNLFEEIGDQKYVNEIKLSLGNVNFRLNNKEKAFEYYTLARDGCLEHKNFNCWETASNNIAVIYTDRNMPIEALAIYSELEKFYLEKDNPRLLAKTYYNIAEVWDESYRDDKKSAEFSKKALDIRLTLGNEADIIDSQLDYGRNMVRLNRYKEAGIHLKEGLRLAEKLDDSEDISNSHRSLAQLYEATQDYKNAYQSMKIHKELKDTLKNQDIMSQIAALETKYDTEKKEKEISILESEKILATQTISNQKRIMAISVGGGSVLAILSMFLFRMFNENRKQKIALEHAVKDKDYLLREIHHRVKNNLQVISSLLYLQSENLSDPAAQDAINVGRGRVKSMALIHQNLYGVDQSSQISLKKYLEDLVVELFDSYNLHGSNVELDLDIEDVMVDVEILVPLGLIINELISNALKHAFEGKDEGNLKVSAVFNEKHLSIEVKDNGVGLDHNATKEGSFGTELIESFVEQLSAKMDVISDEGTKVKIHIPLEINS